ncbi:hypothetical protein ASPZODRAFT_56517 [Penicilliopsis zonata CBS 506.65]|uniref:Altered inheritance of mitochondria protein 21 n=1 Tax=Penicilliopsis zonata CBS 506.65 TaxID=1073090 RepID=A0A1L9SWG3_9EURO|nr:hypothetical protein ASPZODRAFT_56517 [Penicilliopsis zonata CBS 506.65]OJJ51519.1 hypothetical protein ASPZODRAFT_56517 [Penicilliopsis zonata CBS 506.65]
MATQTVPIVPPRPSRSSQQQGLAPESSIAMPTIPPRPANKRLDRSISPMRPSYAPSPLNDWPGSSVSRTASTEPIQRPPSVTIPSLGEEGIEYADIDSHQQAPAQTRNVGSDLQLHAPRPSLPTSSAKAQVQAVTRSDSRQLAEAGFGKAGTPVNDDNERSSRSIHSVANGSRAASSTASSERRQSDDHGIPEIGQRVPMYPGAGDVQAPSPSPYLTPEPTAAASASGSPHRPARHHQRTRSGREVSLPPGSYGLHGHGVQHNDKFEKAWYEKHPDEFVKEEGQYGPGVGTPRPDWALSSDDLNKIVRGAPKRSGLGRSTGAVGTPEEEVGYIASEEYTSRLASPPPDSRRLSQPVAESPLRKMSFPVSEVGEKQSTVAALNDHEEDHSEQPRVIHVDDPYHPLHHPDGFAKSPASGEHLPGLVDGGVEGRQEPILAADEIHPESAHLHPVISPTFERRVSEDNESRSQTPSVHSRPNSRPSSTYGMMAALARNNSRGEEREDVHTPLEDVEEYEPLFPEDGGADKARPLSERLKSRPDLAKHRFPSADIWEDSPNSLQLEATVTTPDLPKPEPTGGVAVAFETPDQEVARKGQTPQINAHRVASHILGATTTQGTQQPQGATRPDLSKQRFPSRDVWEDVPESHQLVTTIEPAGEDEVKSPEAASKPPIPTRPARRPQQDVTAAGAAAAGAATKSPVSPTDNRKPPMIPDRPKPQIPTRPVRRAPEAEQAKDASAAAPAAAPAKSKPAVPSRPVGNKIAALKAGFLSDLNSRLQLGPQAPRVAEKKEEEDGEPEAPVEKAPLSDARKGRARGPARRKPATERASDVTTTTTTTAKLPPIPEIKITETWNVWQVGVDGSLTVGATQSEAAEPLEPVPPVEAAPALAKNMAGEPLSTESIPTEPAAAAAAAADVSPTTAAETVQDSPAQSSSVSEEVLEDMAASADGKKLSDGDVEISQ